MSKNLLPGMLGVHEEGDIAQQIVEAAYEHYRKTRQYPDKIYLHSMTRDKLIQQLRRWPVPDFALGTFGCGDPKEYVLVYQGMTICVIEPGEIVCGIGE